MWGFLYTPDEHWFVDNLWSSTVYMIVDMLERCIRTIQEVKTDWDGDSTEMVRSRSSNLKKTLL